MRRHVNPHPTPDLKACMGPAPSHAHRTPRDRGPIPARALGRRLGLGLWLGLGLGLALGFGASAQTLDTSGDYRQEVQACHEGRTAQDLPTCLLEARNAQADRQRGRLTNQGDFRANALARCGVFQIADDHAACEARIVGPVEITGSVAGGGILRQVAISTVPSGPAPEAAMGAGASPPDGAGNDAGTATPTQPAPPDSLPEDDPDVDTEERMLQESDDAA